jgi:predicted metallo-beta-lactamase superfamily hydrolase
MPQKLMRLSSVILIEGALMLKTNWSKDDVVLDHHVVSDKEFRQILAEISETLYRAKASLNDCPDEIGKSTESQCLSNENERSGTDG